MKFIVLFFATLSAAFAGGVRPDNRFGWDPAHAAEEASADIDRGVLKIYYAGFNASPVGVPPQLFALIENIACGETGSTDTISDEEEMRFRAKQERYAIIYNQEIVRHLLRSAKRDPSELEKALADKKGQEEALRKRFQELEKRRNPPNQALLPTTTAVTSPAGQESRQP